MIKVAFVFMCSLNEPLGIMYLSSYLKKYLPATEIETFDPANSRFYSNIIDFRPDIVAYSLITGTHRSYLLVNNELKKKMQFLSVFGGPHPTHFPDVINERGVDVICRGEGEEAFYELCKFFENGSLTKTDIKNLWIKKEKYIIKNELRSLDENLDALPFPDRDIIYQRFKFLRIQGIKSVIASRGCPFKCSYCYNSGFHELYKGKGKYVRMRSPSNVVDELLYVKNRYSPKFIQFYDDTFAMTKNWLSEFAKDYQERIDLPFNCNIRADLMTSEIAEILKMARCASVNMAIECGNYEYRRSVLKKNITDEQIINAIKMIKAQGIKVGCQNMLGLPNTKLEDDLYTFKFNLKAKPDNPIIHIYQPYPNTELAEYAHSKDFYSGNPETLPRTFYTKSILNIPQRKEREKLLYYFRIFYILPFPKREVLLRLLLKLPLLPFVKWSSILLRAWFYKKMLPFKESSVERIYKVLTSLKTGDISI